VTACGLFVASLRYCLTLADQRARIGGYMRRLITHFNALFLGVILGMVFVAIFHAPRSHRQEDGHANRIAIGYEILGAKNQTTVLLIAGTSTLLVNLPGEFCAYLVNHGCCASSRIIAVSDSLKRPAIR
jgi:hypothetical protein